jgi:protein ImuA
MDLPAEHPLPETQNSAERMAARTMSLQAVRRRMARLDGTAGRHGSLAIGIAAFDDHLPWRGLPRGCLHEIGGSRANGAHANDGLADGAALGFAAHLLARTEGPVLWLSPRAVPYPPGFETMGPAGWTARILAVRARAHLAWAVEEALRTRGLGAVVAEMDSLDLTASRRLQLAAETGGALALLLRGASEGASAATTRWLLSSAPSAPTLWGGPGAMRWRIELARCRGGAPSSWTVEKSDETGAVAVVAPLRDGSDRAHAAALAG